MISVVEPIFVPYDNVSLVEFTHVVQEVEQLIDFSNATRFILTLGVTTIDTDIDTGAIVATANQGELKFDLAQLTLPATLREAATLVAFDPTHPAGQLIVCAADKLLIFEVQSC